MTLEMSEFGEHSSRGFPTPVLGDRSFGGSLIYVKKRCLEEERLCP